MHSPILVVGEDPMAAVNSRPVPALGCPDPDPVDWAAIGGRFTGTLVLRPGATTGRVYGDAIPDFEAQALAEMRADNVDAVRHTSTGPGVDQARNHDIDWDATSRHLGPAEAVVDGVWHCPPPALVAAHLVRLNAWMVEQNGGRFGLTPKQQAQLKAGHDAAHAWGARLDALIPAIPDHALVTVVDAHRFESRLVAPHTESR